MTRIILTNGVVVEADEVEVRKDGSLLAYDLAENGNELQENLEKSVKDISSVASRIMEYLRSVQNDVVTTTEVASAVNTSPTNASRILKTMQERGHVAKDGRAWRML